MPSYRLPPSANRFKRRLLAWYRKQARDLPWRRTRDAYRVIVSEFMLQQTQVSRVEQFYPRFLKQYPTITHLAKAKPKAVRESWDGLGYYARARNLHQLAKEVVAHHGGALPSEPEELRKLPGVGAYTAGAVAAFAYEKREPAVDTNVDRVLTRVFFKRAPKQKTLWAIARALLPQDGAVVWEFNQALMDLGATVCTARVMKCEICPVRSVCRTGGATRGKQTEVR